MEEQGRKLNVEIRVRGDICQRRLEFHYDYLAHKRIPLRKHEQDFIGLEVGAHPINGSHLFSLTCSL